MLFQRGASGNPGGRPKGHSDMRELARQHGPECIAMLVEIRNNPKNRTADRLRAVEILLDRGFGKPTQAVDADMALDAVLTVRWMDDPS